MSARLPPDLAERVLSSHPLPIADAAGALVAADSAFEQRDRVVEVFRAALRTLSALVLAARVQFGKGPGAEPPQIPELIRSLRSRGLTDGQWFAIVREMLRPWAQAPGSHPLSDLVTLVHGRKAEFPKLVDELLAMRKSETVAHGASGTKAALAEILERRVPQLAKVLALLEPLWAKARLVVPLARPESDEEPQSAWLLMGDTPSRGRWRRVELAAGVRLAPGEALLADAEGRPLLALHPLVLVRRPSPEAVEEVFVLDGGSKKGAVFVALPSMAEHRETEAWTALSRALSDEEPAPDNPEIGAERPFRGLASFGPEHASLFHGREEQTEALANRIRRHPFVTVTGPSGSGKTSLLRAGALPTLAGHAVALLRPGPKPLETLCARIAEATAHHLAAPALLEKLRADPSSLGALLAAWSRETAGIGPAPAEKATTEKPSTKAAATEKPSSEKATTEKPSTKTPTTEKPSSEKPSTKTPTTEKPSTENPPKRPEAASPPAVTAGGVYRALLDASPPRIVIVVDQAEEMLTLCHDEAERAAFARALASAGASPDGPSRVVVSVREDFFGRLATVGPLRGVYSQVVEVVTTPDREALARTLYLPAKAFGYAFEDEQLLATMVDAVAAEPAALALLQFCADRLWDVRDRTWRRLGWDAYRALGGVEGALAAHADSVLAGLSPAQQRACRGLLLRLVTADRTRAVIGKRELLESAAVPGDAAAVLDRLIGARLLTAGESDDGGEARVEIVHEALIRHWGALAGWLDEDVEGQRLTHALRQAAREWETRRRPRGLLWRGEALDDLRRWRKRATDRLTGEEAEFVAASEAEERRGARIRRGLGAGAFVATGAFAAFMFFQWRAAEDARVETEHQKARAEVRGLVSEARNQEPAGKLGEALALLRAAASLEAAEQGPAPTLVSLDLERLARAGAASRVLAGHAWGLMQVALSPDGELAATASRDGTAKLWDLGTGALVRTLEGTDPVLSIAYSADGKTIATSNGTAKADGGFVKLWDAATGAVRHTLKLDSTASHAAFSPDGKLLVTCTEKNGAALWNTESGAPVAALGDPASGAAEASFSADGARVVVRAGKEARVHAAPGGELIARLEGHDKPVLDAAFSRSGALVATASVDGTVRVWDARTGEEKARLAPDAPGYGKPQSFHSLAWGPEDRALAVGAKDGSVRLVDPSSAAVLHTLHQHASQVESVAFSPDGRRILSASLDGKAIVWDAATGAVVEVLRGHKEGLLGAVFAGNERVITISDDRTARLWDVTDGPFVAMLDGHARSVDRLCASADGSILVSASADKTARVWDTRTFAALAVLPDHKGPVAALAVSPDGKTVVTGAMDTPTRVWDARTGAVRATLPGQDKGANAAAFSPDGALFAVASIDGPASLWDAASATEKRKLEGHERKIAQMVFSHDGRRLVTASWDGTARIWDVAGAAPPVVLKGPEGWVTAAVFSPDDRTVAIAAGEQARLFDAATGALRHELSGHEQQVNAITYSPGGELLATASLDGTLRTWRSDTGAPVKTFTGHAEAVMDLAFSADGERLFSAGDTTVRVWDVALAALIDTLIPHRTDGALRGATAVLPLGGAGLIAASAQDGSVLLFRGPRVDRGAALAATGALGNHRVCRATLRVVPIAPQPAADSVWAPEQACKEQGNP